MKKTLFTYILSLSMLLTQTPIHADATDTVDTRPPVLVSEGAVLMDANTGQILYSKAPDQSYPPASITKLMTALLVLENMAPGEEITFSYNAVMSIERGSSHIGMREGETITVENALHGLLLQSANEVANGLAEAVGGSIEEFCDLMNQRARDLGATGSNFLNPHGLYDDNHYTTAMDMALITQELLKHDLFLQVMSHTKWQIPETNLVDEIRYLHQNHKLLNPVKDPSLYREDTIAGKTGYTIQSGHTLVTVAEQDGRRLIAVSLRTDANHLYSDTNAMLDYGFEAFTNTTISSEDIQVTSNLVAEDGQIGTARAVASIPLRTLVLKGTDLSGVTHTEDYMSDLPEDTAVGDVIGLATYSLNGSILGSVDLIITEITLDQDEITPSYAEEPEEVLEDEEEAPKTTKNFTFLLWLIPLLLLPFAIYLLYRADKSKRMTYRQYKAMRESSK